MVPVAGRLRGTPKSPAVKRDEEPAVAYSGIYASEYFGEPHNEQSTLLENAFYVSKSGALDSPAQVSAMQMVEIENRWWHIRRACYIRPKLA